MLKRFLQQIDKRHNAVVKKLDLEKWPMDSRLLNMALKQVLELHKPQLQKMENGRYTLQCNECFNSNIFPCWTYSVTIGILD